MISSTVGTHLPDSELDKDGNETKVDILNVNCIKQEGSEKNYRLKPCRAKCLRTEF